MLCYYLKHFTNFGPYSGVITLPCVIPILALTPLVTPLSKSRILFDGAVNESNNKELGFSSRYLAKCRNA